MPRRRDQELLQAVGRRVAEVRKRKGMTQDALSARIGVESVSWSRLETGQRGLSLSTLAAAAEALGVSLGDLLDIDRTVPEPADTPDDVEIHRLLAKMDSGRRELVMRLARELAKP